MTEPQSNFEEPNNVDTSLLSPTIKSKNYRVKNNEWHCRICSIYCNSTLQFEMHLVSQKHKIIDLEQKTRRETSQITEASHESTNSKAEFNSNKECVASSKEECITPSPDENNNNNNNSGIQSQSAVAITNQSQRSSNVIRIKSSYSPVEISQNLIAIKFNVNAEKYLIPENKKNGKFEKFGFYCSLCNAYMTGQIQLIMHVKGARHQYFSPNEIPGYKSSKLFNPSQYQGTHKHKSDRQQMQYSKNRPQQLNDKERNMPSIVNHVNEIKINNYTSTISPTLGLHNANNGGTYYDYLVRNEALMYGSQNHNHSHQHHHHHHHQRAMFNSIHNFNQIAPNVSGVNGNYQFNGQASNIDYFNQHHSSIYVTPSLLRQQQQDASKYLQLPTLLQYSTPQQQVSSQTVTQNYGLYMNEQSAQSQMAFHHQQTPPPPPPPPSSLTSSSTSQENLMLSSSAHVTTTPVSSYQIAQNNVSDQYNKGIAQNNVGTIIATRLKARFNNTCVNNSSNPFKDVTNLKRDDAGYYFNQRHQFQHHTPQFTSSGISIITSKPTGLHQAHHHLLPQQQHHQGQCNFYFNAQVPSLNGDANNLNEFLSNQATSY